MLNLYLWALRFDGWSAEEDRELPAGEYVEAFVKATGIPGPQPTDETLQAWTYQLGYVAAEVRNLAEFVTAMTRYRATGSTVGHAFLPSQVAKLERYTGVKADYGD
jgi:ferric-dicitrate binding protein FerR (iron transport regulator)